MAEGIERDEGMETAGGARSATARAREAADSARRDLLDRAVEQKDELKQRAAGMADERRVQAAGRVESISRALQGAADSLRESGEPQLSSWVSQAASQVDRIVGYMQGKPAEGMLHDLEDLARRNPALFLGGTYLAGMAAGRFLRASAPSPQYSAEGAPSMHDPLGTTPTGGYAAGGAPGAGGVSAGFEREGGTQPWTGVGVGPSVSGTPDDGVDRAGVERTSYRGTGEAGDGEPGLTDADLREAWNQTDARRGADSGYGASSTEGARDERGPEGGYGTSSSDDVSDPRGV